MTGPYDHEALWTKAKLFLNRAMDDDGARSFDEQALWASLALEALAKAALARVSPLLVAEPTEDGANLLIACGLIGGEARFTSIRAKTLMSRCHKAFKPFDEHEAMMIVAGRNEYLHGGGTGFLIIPPHAWWPRYWAQAAILVTALDRDVKQLVGEDRERTVNDYLGQNAKNIERRTEALIERARQRLQQRRDGTLSARLTAEWKSGDQLSDGLSHSQSETCPACQSIGLLEGEDVIDTKVHYVSMDSDPDDYIYPAVSVTLTLQAEHFSCPACQLVLNSPKLVQQAGLPATFEDEGDVDDLADEPDYGND